MAPWVCMLCGYRGSEDYGECQECRQGPLLDIRKEEVRDLIREHYARIKQSRDGWWLWLGIAIGFVVVLGVAIGVPMYRKARHAVAMPFFADQIILMGLIAWGSQWLLSRLFRVEPPFPEVK